MTSEVQGAALAALAEVWELSPDVPLGQLFAHIGFLGEAHLGRGLGYLDDDEMIAILYRHKAELLARFEASSGPAIRHTVEATSLSGSPTLSEASPSSETVRPAV
jgi:hypothetical protein